MSTKISYVDATKGTFKCELCSQTLGFPVRIQNDIRHSECKCDKLYCLPCLRDYLGMNTEQRITLNRACPSCKKELKIGCTVGNAVLIYTHDTEIATYLDTKCGNIVCPRCKLWNGTRMEWHQQHIHVCPESHMSCQKCNTQMLRKDYVGHDCAYICSCGIKVKVEHKIFHNPYCATVQYREALREYQYFMTLKDRVESEMKMKIPELELKTDAQITEIVLFKAQIAKRVHAMMYLIKAIDDLNKVFDQE